MVRAVASYPAHPDVIAQIVGIAEADYDLSRRRFLLDYPNETPPPVIKPLGDKWLHDLIDLHLTEGGTLGGIFGGMG